MTLLKMSIYGAVIILAIILIRAFTLHKLPKKTFLILWSVALLRLLIPFEIASEYSLYSLVPEEVAGQLSDMSEGVTEQFSNALLSEKSDNAAPDNTTTVNKEVITLEEAIQNLPESQYKEQEISSSNETEAGQNTDNPIYLPTENLTTDAIPLPNIEQNPPADLVDIIPKEQPTAADWLQANPLFLPWIIGVVLCAAFFLFFYIRAYIEFADATPVTDEYARDFLKHHWTNRVIRLRQSDKISAPLTYGIFCPVILLPKKMDWENHDQLHYVLYHEFTHIRRFDMIPKLLMATALCLHWFNPLVWAMYYFFNRDIELSCDECVVKYYEENHTKADYARTLISMEEKKSRITPLCNNFSKNAIEERITAIMKFKKTTISMIILGIVIVAAVAITLTTSAKKPEATVTDVPTATPAPTMVPFKMIDFESGEFDEKELAKVLWQRYEEFATVYNTCINKSMNKDPYTEEDFVELEIDQDKMIFVEQYLPVADSRFPTMQTVKDYVETVCTKEGSDFFLSSTFLNMYRPDDGYEWSPKYVEQDGVLYTKPYDMQAPLLFTAGEPTVYRGEVFFYLLEDNRVAMYARNNPTDSIYRTYFKQENGIWYVDNLSLDIHGIPDKDGNTLYRFSVPMEELAGAESETNTTTSDWQEETPIWQQVARSAIGMLYGETDAYDVAKREAAVLSLEDFGLQDLNIDLSAYSTDREWWESGAFYDEAKNCYYVIYVLSAQTEVSDGPGILYVTAPADQPENYTILSVGDAGELASSALWFDTPVKVGTNIYFNSGQHDAPMWFIDTITMRLHSLAYVNDALDARASAYLSSKGMGTSCDAIYHVEGQMGDHVVFSAEISHAFDLGLPYFTVYFVYHNNRMVGELSLIAEYIDEHTLPLQNGVLTPEEDIIRLTLDEFVQAATECFEDYFTSSEEEAEQGPWHITSVQMTAPNTAQVEFMITESAEFEVYTDGNATLEYDFEKGAWYVRFYREYPPDYLAALGAFPALAAEEVIVSEKNWNLAAIDEESLPRFTELVSAGGKVTGEASDSINIGRFYTVSLDGIEYFFLGEDASTRDDRAWHLAITTPDYPLSGGAKAGMTTEELLALYPDLAKTELDWDDIVFQALYGPSMFNFRDDQFPESFLAKYDYAYTAYLEKGHDGLPVCIAFLIKGDSVSAITVYMPTAG